MSLRSQFDVYFIAPLLIALAIGAGFLILSAQRSTQMSEQVTLAGSKTRPINAYVKVLDGVIENLKSASASNRDAAEELVGDILQPAIDGRLRLAEHIDADAAAGLDADLEQLREKAIDLVVARYAMQEVSGIAAGAALEFGGSSARLVDAVDGLETSEKTDTLTALDTGRRKITNDFLAFVNADDRSGFEPLQARITEYGGHIKAGHKLLRSEKVSGARNIKKFAERDRSNLLQLVMQKGSAMTRRDEALGTFNQINDSAVRRVGELETLAFAELSAISQSMAETSAVTKWATIGAAAVLLVLLTGCALFVRKRVTGPIAGLSGAMGLLAQGETDAAIRGEQRMDEIGSMARGLATFRAAILEREHLQTEQQREMATRSDRERLLKELLGEFETGIGEVVSEIDAASGRMKGTAASLYGAVETASGRTSAVANASTDASTNVRSVAEAADQVTTSIRDIGQQVSHATDVVNNAAQRAESTSANVADLAEAAGRIGEVVSLIQDIAEQTNLLALNATIEAARAGEAGRGFAVVASEVKELAGQTAKATEEITRHIEGVQGSTNDAVDAIGAITQIMAEVRDITGSIAGSVDRQMEATSQIAGSIQEAAAGTSGVADSVAGLNAVIEETSQSAGDVQSASEELEEKAAAMRSRVTDFLGRVASV